MILVRHGLMLVGFPFAGKTKSYHALGHALKCVSEKVGEFCKTLRCPLCTYIVLALEHIMIHEYVIMYIGTTRVGYFLGLFLFVKLSLPYFIPVDLSKFINLMINDP